MTNLQYYQMLEEKEKSKPVYKWDFDWLRLLEKKIEKNKLKQ